jgi:hypothetical protein
MPNERILSADQIRPAGGAQRRRNEKDPERKHPERKKRRRSVAALGYTRRRRAWPGDTHTLTAGHRGPFARVRTGRFGRGAHETFSPVVVMVVVGRSSGGRTQPPGWLRRVAAVRSRPRATGRARERGVSRR